MQAIKRLSKELHQEVVVLRSLEEEGRMEESSVKGIETGGTTGSSESDTSPPSLIAREGLNGIACVG